jgi:mannose-6-phosphate isomerase-like protein (cupin superfamily)
VPHLAQVRLAKDCLVNLPQPEGDLHRAVHSAVIDYGLVDLTEGQIRAMGTLPGFCTDKPGFSSPWHCHDCEMQIAIVLDGSAEIAFSPTTARRVCRGEIAFIPGHVTHDVRKPSADYQITELTFPGAFATTEVAPPAADSASPGRVWGGGAALREADGRGLISYRYPVEAPYSDRYLIRREWRDWGLPFEAGSLAHEDETRILFVIGGTRTIDLNGEQHRLGFNDLLTLPPAVECADIAASGDHEAIWIHLQKLPA